MGSFISEISNYAFVVIMAIYVVTNICVFFFKNPEKHKHFYMLQTLLAISFHAVGYITLFMRTEDPRYFFFFAFQEIILFALVLIFRTIYRSVSRLMLNNVIMLLFVGFTILGRLAFMNAVRQFVITVIALAVSMLIPWIMSHTQFVKKIGYVYCGIGILALGAVWLTGEITNGSKLAFTIEGMSFQPSEFVKITLVFFVAALLSNKKDPYRYISTGLFSLVHVLILVLSRDLGGAGIYCMIYLFMLYLANKSVLTLGAGAVLGAGAFWAALHVFSHVQIRVQNWLNPWTDMSNTGYQITQSLFAIGTGGWEGMGLLQGDPTSIPYVNEDFVFSAIAEEFGVMFSVLLILLYLVTILHIFRMSYRSKELLHKFLLLGIGVSLGTQVILTIGGGTRFIPLTGVTLPLISMGGSSLTATLLMFGVIQGIYIKEFAYFENNDVEEEEVTAKKEHKNSNIPILISSILYGLVFLGMIVNLAVYVETESYEAINSIYNPRDEILAQHNIRGSIVTEQGDVLAYTEVYGDEEHRVYPYNVQFAHVVGYSTNGGMGIEKIANMSLLQSNASISDKVDNDLNRTKDTGDTVVSTLNVRMQEVAFKSLGAFKGAIIVTDIETGKILSMVSKPDFDPNYIAEEWDSIINNSESSVLLNRVTHGQYPPGSTFKIIDALEYYRQYPDEVEGYFYQCNGSLRYDERKITCYHGTSHGGVDLPRSFAKSCNCSFANIGLKLNREAMSNTLAQLLFGQDLPAPFGSSKQSVVHINGETNDSEMVQISIGQGTALMTPLHLNMITCAIANDGQVMTPMVISRIESVSGDKVKEYNPEVYATLMTPEEAEYLGGLMNGVVENGTGDFLLSASYTSAGKTGSAEYGTAKGDSHAWFTGYAPAEDPKVAVTIIVEGAGSGGDYAVPIAKRLFDIYFEQYGQNQ